MKTADLEGALIDYWVAKAEGYAITWCNQHDDPNDLYYPNFYWSGNDLTGKRIVECMFQPSMDWSIAGPIIEREKICLEWSTEGWDACRMTEELEMKMMPDIHRKEGPTPLLAAMRCFVAQKYGEEVPDK